MNTPNERISAALDADDKEFLASLDADRGMFALLAESWNGPLGGWAKFSFGIAIIIGLGLAFSLWQALTSQGDAMVGWGMVCLALLIMQGFLKEWMFAQMNMVSILSELKRLQIQVALLSEKQE